MPIPAERGTSYRASGSLLPVISGASGNLLHAPARWLAFGPLVSMARSP